MFIPVSSLFLDGHLVLDKELFVHTKPGLSSFAKEPEKVFMYTNVKINKNSFVTITLGYCDSGRTLGGSQEGNSTGILV